MIARVARVQTNTTVQRQKSIFEIFSIGDESHLSGAYAFGGTSCRCASMFLFLLSLSLQCTKTHPIWIIVLSFHFVTRPLPSRSPHNNHLFASALIAHRRRIRRALMTIISPLEFAAAMTHNDEFSSSSNTTLAFDTSSITYLNETNLNQNANDMDDVDIHREKTSVRRLIQSSTDITTPQARHDLSPGAFVHRENSYGHTPAIRIESALDTSDYSYLLTQSIVDASRPIIDLNTNRTSDLMNRTGAGDDQYSFRCNDKQVQTPAVPSDGNYYLPLEQVAINNRSTMQFTSKQLVLISFTVFIFVILFCLTTIFLIA